MNGQKTNVGPLERLIRVTGGGLLAVVGIVLLLALDQSWWTATIEVAAILLGIDFLYTGITGYCPLYHRLGWSTARRPQAVEPDSAVGTDAKSPSNFVGAEGVARVKVALPVFGLSCGGGGSLLIERVIKELSGVVDAYVNPATERAYVEYDPKAVRPEQIAEAIRKAGYKTSLPPRVLREGDA